MSKFVAGEILETLDWDFTAFGGRKGVVTEPTEERLGILLVRTASIIEDLAKERDNLSEDASPEQVATAIEKLSRNEIFPDMMAKMSEAYGEFCLNEPSAEELQALPYRIRMEFFKWLGSEVRPEIFGAATNVERPRLRSVARA
jgi:hypothetical protein